MSNGINTHNKLYERGKKMDSYQTPPSSLIYLPLGVHSMQDWLTSLQQASPVSRTAFPGHEEVLKIPEISGLTRSELFVKWHQDISSWKTWQVSFLAELMNEAPHTGELWLDNLPKSGMTAS